MTQAARSVMHPERHEPSGVFITALCTVERESMMTSVEIYDTTSEMARRGKGLRSPWRTSSR